MNQYVVDIAHKIGMDKSIAYSSGSKVVSGIAGVCSVFFITTFLTGVEQGFYYTFGSILALQVFFELGLTGIMTQYVAHEVSHLQFNDDCQYKGDEKYKSRLASLVHFCLKWYSVLAIIILVFLLIVGFVFFNRYGDSQSERISWRVPWTLICFGTSINVLQSPFISIFMGLGRVKEMSKIAFWQQIFVSLTIWIGLALGFKLYVLGISSVISVIIWQIYVWKTGLARIIVRLWSTTITERVVYIKEIFPYQWRIALSWVSGYFIFHLFNPVLFAMEGAVVAGQMGLTLQALNSLQAFSMSWLNTKVPFYSQLIAIKDYYTLDTMFNVTLHHMFRACLTLMSSFFIAIWLLDITQLQFNGHVLSDRFLSYVPTLFLMIPILLNQYTASWATYLRCHKREPFLIISLCGALADGLSTLLFGHLFGLYGIVIGYCTISLLFFPWGYWIYRTKKVEWHRE